MALFRALESSRPGHSRLFCDPFAPLFLHQWRKLFLRIRTLWFGLQICGAATRSKRAGRQSGGHCPYRRRNHASSRDCQAACFAWGWLWHSGLSTAICATS